MPRKVPTSAPATCAPTSVIPADRAHGDHDAQHRGHDAEAGQAVGDLVEHRGRLHRLAMVLLQFQLQQRLQLVRLDVAADHQAQAIGDEIDQVVVGLHLGVVGEDAAFGRALDVVFQRHEAFPARLVEQFVEQAEDVDVVLLLVARALEHAHGGLQGLLHGFDRGADQERAQRRTADDHQFIGLPQRAEFAVRADVAAEHAEDDDEKSNDDEHGADAGRGYLHVGPFTPFLKGGVRSMSHFSGFRPPARLRPHRAAADRDRPARWA